MYNGFVESEERVTARLARINSVGDVEKMKAITAGLDDRTPEWLASHDLSDPRNQLPTKAERQEFSRERIDEALTTFKKLTPTQQEALLRKQVNRLKKAGKPIPPELKRYARPEANIIAWMITAAVSSLLATVLYAALAVLMW